MPVHIALSAFVVAASIPFLIWTLAGSARGARAIARDNLGGAVSVPLRLVRQRRFRPVILPSSYVDDLDRRIGRAGTAASMTVDRYLGVKVVATLVVFFVSAFLGLKLGGAPAILVPFLATTSAWLLPDLQLSARANARENEVSLQLPDVLDQLTISIEAGLGFDAALNRLVESSKGPVVDEIARVLQDMRLGLARDVALRSLAERTESPDLRTFANAMAQAGKHGLAMATVLRAQAAEAREKRKFRAEEQAHKVPVKILMPLVLCVLPTLFIILIGPAIIRYNDGGFGG